MKDLLDLKSLEFVKQCVTDVTIPHWKIYHSIFCPEEDNTKEKVKKACQVSASRLWNKPAVKHFKDIYQEKKLMALSEVSMWTKERLIYEHSRIHREAMDVGNLVLHKGKPVIIEDENGEPKKLIEKELGAANKALESIGRLIGAYQEDNEQKATVINLADYFEKKTLE